MSLQYPSPRAALAVVAFATTIWAARGDAHDLPPLPRVAKPADSKAAPPPPPSLPRPLADLLRDATAVVLASVVRTEAFDEDRLHLHRLHTDRVLQGRLDATDPGVVEIRGTSARPPLLRAGEVVVLVVRSAPRMSYLDAQLPPGEWLEVVAGRDGIVRVSSDAEAEAIATALTESLTATASTPEEVRANRRRRAFVALAGPSPRLASDAVSLIRGLPDLTPLAPDELRPLGIALAGDTAPADARAVLLAVLGERGAREALPAIRAARADSPAVLDALLRARAALGDPAGRSDLDRWLTSTDPSVRAVAVTALAAEPGDAALREVGTVATSDPDPGVRGAAVDALGASGRPEALPIVVVTFDGTDRDLQQRSARAVMAIGGDAADEALVRLALTGTSPESRSYAALVLMLMHGRDHPAVHRLEAASPPDEVRHLLEHGLEMGHRHDAGDPH